MKEDLPTDEEVLAALLDLEPMTCCRCGKETTANKLNLCIHCGEGFCDHCAPACKCSK